MDIDAAPDRQKKQTIWFTEALRDEVREWPKAVRVDIGEELNKVE
jgi:hypothetical protein